MLAEKAVFPRDKLCGDFITPGAVRLLREAGLVDPALAALPAALRGMRLTVGETVVPLPFPEGAPGWALGRRDLDAALMRAARAAGARILQGFRIEEVEDAGSVVLASGVGRLEGRVALECRFVVDAGGRNALVPRRRRWRRVSRWPVRYAVGAWFENVRGLSDHGEMHVLRDGYIGVSPIGDGLAGAAGVVDARLFSLHRRDAAGLLMRLIRSSAELSLRFERATAITPTRGAGPLAHGASRFGRGRILITGDAAAFVDPFTGEGIHSALLGGTLAARTAAAVIRGRSGPAEASRAAALYERELRRALAPRFALSRILQGLLCAPSAARRVAAVLSRRQDLAAALVAVTGGVERAGSLLEPGFMGPFLREAIQPAGLRLGAAPENEAMR